MTTQAQTTKDYEKSTMDRLERLESAAPLTMSRQDYERLYLTPKSAVQGDFRKVFGNPTPLGLIGFLVATTPLSCSLMGWRGSGSGGAAIIGAFWLAFAATLTPYYNAEASFLADGANANAGITQFYSSFAFALLFFALLVFILFICSLRTNIAFVVIFFLLTIAVALLAAAYWQLAKGRAELGVKLEKASASYRSEAN
ncbi:hypothetical protein Q7P35_008791 [Cladosporium inversicolor]